jgi:hypothetical protein
MSRGFFRLNRNFRVNGYFRQSVGFFMQKTDRQHVTLKSHNPPLLSIEEN